MIEDRPDPEESVTPPPVDEEDSITEEADEEVAREMIEAARQEREYPGDETDEG